MIFIFVVFLAGILRLSFLSTIEFKADQAIALFLASRPLFGHPFPPGATTSSYGILNPPLFLYILFPFVKLSLNPQFISACIGLINAIAIGFFYLIIKNYYGKATAFFSSMLLAVSPWSVIFSRNIWTQDLILPLSITLFYSFQKIFFEQRKIYWILYTLSTMFLLQIHQTTIFFLLALNIFLLIKKPKYHYMYMLTGFILGSIALIPYLLFEINYKFTDFFLIFQAADKTSANFQLLTFMRPFQLLSQGDFHYLFGDDIIQFATQYSLVYKLRMLFYVEYLLLTVGAILFFVRYKQHRLFVYITLLLPLIYFIFRIKPYLFYFIILTPLLFLFLGMSFSYLSKRSGYIKIFGYCFFVALIAISIAYNVSFFLFLTEYKHLSGDYGTIFAVTEKDKKTLLKQYKHTSEYNEMLIANYVPPQNLHGNITLETMLYDHNETKKHLTALDNRLKQVPEDARVLHELLAYYTIATPNRQALGLLEKKADVIPYYKYIHAQAYYDFLSVHFRKVYRGSLGFAFEYPMHWQASENGEKEVKVVGDGYIFSLVPLTISSQNMVNCGDSYHIYATTVLNQKIQERNCVDTKQKWLRTSYGPFLIRETSFVLMVQPDGSLPKRKFTDKETAEVVQMILSSLRI